MKINILDATQECFKYLLDLQNEDKTLFFVPRRRNNLNRLEQGYFFIGSDEYMQISFWDSQDDKQKIHSIAFVIQKNGKIYIELSGTNGKEKKEYLEKLAKYISENTGMASNEKTDGKWKFYYNTDNICDDNYYLDYLKHFITYEKVLIDDYLLKNKSWIKLLNAEFNCKYVLSLLQKYPYVENMIRLKYFEEENVSTISEGKKKFVYTYTYERNSKNRAEAIKHCRDVNDGRLVCAVCGFDFEKEYCNIGKDFIEVHHNKPLAQNKGEETVVNPITDLDCVCSNCHRMLHRLKGVAPTVENLKNVKKQP